jgi:hypothetical protein
LSAVEVIDKAEKVFGQEVFVDFLEAWVAGG